LIFTYIVAGDFGTRIIKSGVFYSICRTDNFGSSSLAFGGEEGGSSEETAIPIAELEESVGQIASIQLGIS
jgi:hypothetical protein